MSNSIATQTWEMINNVNASLKYQNEEDQASIQDNAGNRVASLQLIEKDVVLAADPDAGSTVSADHQQSTTAGQPSLTTPTINWNALQGVGSQQEGLISIIGYVLALQAKSNSNFWSTLWQQATTSMQM